MRDNQTLIIIVALAIFLALSLFAAFYFALLGAKHRILAKSRIRVGTKEFNIEIAKTMSERVAGLSGRDGLDDGEGTLFLFDKPGNYGFWMKDMKFAIDIVWIKDGRVTGVFENVEPEPGKSMLGLKVYFPPGDADRVLEIKSGGAKAYGIKAGDEVKLLL